ncbi:DUF350 domain-containing protein [Gottfriedia luciferensis]|uniref:DUF350 domain-containing protein n=1 Tax=Gottfriedia luciferensis TaxID=178774 RepID=UPI000B43C148|nr:DUF350 domain-containing protein [Gottfriedia luciferensis]
MESFVSTLLYLGSGLILLFIGFIAFTFSTKMSEQKLILEDGNIAVALKLAGKLVGLAIVIMSSAKYSVSFTDFIIWSLIGVLAQMVTYWIAEFILFPKVSFAKKVEEGNIAVAILLFTLSVTVGLLISGSISY